MTTCTDAFPKVDELVDGYEEDDDNDDDDDDIIYFVCIMDAIFLKGKRETLMLITCSLRIDLKIWKFGNFKNAVVNSRKRIERNYLPIHLL